MRIIKVTNCYNCPLQDREWDREDQRLVYTCYHDDANFRSFVDAKIIQDWCPLEQVKEIDL